MPSSPRLMLLSSDEELPVILRAWDRVCTPQSLIPFSSVDFEQLLNRGSEPLWWPCLLVGFLTTGTLP